LGEGLRKDGQRKGRDEKRKRERGVEGKP